MISSCMARGSDADFLAKGTYIRALARDIGEALNSGAHLIGLIRTRVGEVKLEDCMQVEGFAEWLEKQEIETINE